MCFQNAEDLIFNLGLKNIWTVPGTPPVTSELFKPWYLLDSCPPVLMHSVSLFGVNST